LFIRRVAQKIRGIARRANVSLEVPIYLSPPEGGRTDQNGVWRHFHREATLTTQQQLRQHTNKNYTNANAHNNNNTIMNNTTTDNQTTAAATTTTTNNNWLHLRWFGTAVNAVNAVVVVRCCAFVVVVL
jgi:hypothetical protein